jgi:hypothetical protein
MPPSPEKPDAPSPQKPPRTWRPEEDRPSKVFQWAVSLPDKFSSRKFNGYQLFLVILLGVLFYVLVLDRLGG